MVELVAVAAPDETLKISSFYHIFVSFFDIFVIVLATEWLFVWFEFDA